MSLLRETFNFMAHMVVCSTGMFYIYMYMTIAWSLPIAHMNLAALLPIYDKK